LAGVVDLTVAVSGDAVMVEAARVVLDALLAERRKSA